MFRTFLCLICDVTTPKQLLLLLLLLGFLHVAAASHISNPHRNVETLGKGSCVYIYIYIIYMNIYVNIHVVPAVLQCNPSKFHKGPPSPEPFSS